jgi:tetratricopeptide (TPR) repeat protein
MRNITAIAILLVFVALLQAKTWEKDYTYKATEFENEETSRIIAFSHIQPTLNSEVGEWLFIELNRNDSNDVDQVNELSKESIIALIPLVTEINITEANWQDKSLSMKSVLTAEKSELIEKVGEFSGRETDLGILLASQKRGNDYLIEIEILRLQLTETVEDLETQKIKEDYLSKCNLLESEYWLKKGFFSFNNDDYEQSTICFNKVTELNPQLSEASLLEMGNMYANKGDYNNSIKCFELAVLSNPKSAISYTNMGNVYVSIGNKVKAIECYQKAIQAQSDYVHAYINIGSLYQNYGDNENAIKYLNEALKIDPEFELIYSNLGLAYAQSGDYDTGIEYYRRLINKNPDFVKVYTNLGTAYLYKQDYEAAIENFTIAIQKNESDADAYTNMGSAYLGLSDLDNAISSYEKSLEYLPNDPTTIYNLGAVYELKDKRSKSLEYFMKAASLGHLKAKAWLKQNGYFAY